MAHTEEMHELFPSCVLKRQYTGLDALNAELLALARRLCQATNVAATSGRGGLRSTGNLFDAKEPCVAEFRRMVSDCLSTFLSRAMSRNFQLVGDLNASTIIHGWAYIMRERDYIDYHVHRSGLITGTYYLSAPPTTGTGTHGDARLVLINPNAGALMMHTSLPLVERTMIDPRPGQMVMFMSYVPHLVEPFEGPGERIALSFDVQLVPLSGTAQAQPVL